MKTTYICIKIIHIYMYVFVGHKAVIAGNSIVLKFKINNYLNELNYILKNLEL